MRDNFFNRYQEGSDQIARERLRCMTETISMDKSPVLIHRMKKEIFDILSKYYEISPEDYEIRVILKQNRKRA